LNIRAPYISGNILTSEELLAYQYSETNVMHFIVSLLRIKGLYVFRVFHAHPQEALHKRYLVYCVHVTSVGCYQDWSGTEDGQVMLETCRGP
jgi:hypothetical protein